MTVRRPIHAAFLAAAALSTTLACKFEPKPPELRYSLNQKVVEKNPDLLGDGGAQAQLEGALELMFGTAANPSFLALPEWLEEGFDPNYWGEDQLKADEAAWAEVQTSNRRRFARQLAALEAGDWRSVSEPRAAWDLWERWLEYVPTLEKNGLDAALKDELVALFVDYYPALRNSAQLYREQCFHCHGATGGGDGSTSAFLNPRPRDYRPGKFKFTAQKEKAKPRHADLFRILAEGIYTTSMPSFRRFSDAELHGLADYVRLLAARGETEIFLAEGYNPDDGLHFDNVKENYELVVSRWREADEKVIAFEGEIPEETPERIEHGRALFMSEVGANCIKCHGASGRGDGVSAWEPGKEGQEYAKDEWGNEIVPRDLTRGVFRFGRRPIDLYRRIYAGINGTPMPEHFGMTITENGAQRTLNEDDIWDLVFYVRSLSSHAAEPTTAHAPGHAPAGHAEEGHAAEGHASEEHK